MNSRVDRIHQSLSTLLQRDLGRACAAFDVTLLQEVVSSQRTALDVIADSIELPQQHRSTATTLNCPRKTKNLPSERCCKLTPVHHPKESPQRCPHVVQQPATFRLQWPRIHARIPSEHDLTQYDQVKHLNFEITPKSKVLA